MLLIMSKDWDVQAAAKSADDWGKVVRWRERDYEETIGAIGRHEDLCITAHGNDQEIGDAGDHAGSWSWTAKELANSLERILPPDYAGDIYVSACMKSVANFATRLRIGFDEDHAFMSTTCFGHNRPVGMGIAKKTDIRWQGAEPKRIRVV